MFITDPPLLADIGHLNFSSDNATLKVDLITKFEDGLLNVTLMETDMEMDPVALDLDGISDTVNVVSRFMTFSSNILRDRLVSLSHYEGALQRLNALINKLIGMIPDEIDIPGTKNLYLEGGISSKLQIKKDEYMKIPFDLSLQNEDFPFYKNNTSVFGDVVQSDYQIQTYLSDYILESGLWALFYDDKLSM
jgi:hypothetical protein